MSEHQEPVTPDANHVDPAAPRNAEGVIAELRAVLNSAAEQYLGEQRVDVSNEVADTVRFNQASILWHERIPPRAALKVYLSHENLPLVVGQALWVSAQFLCLSDERYEHLINLEHIVAVSGLAYVTSTARPTPVAEQMNSIWFGGLLEDQQSASWFVSLNQVLVGPCTRLGLDAVDIRQGATDMTLIRGQLIAVRRLLTG